MKITGIIMASGFSNRMGGNKLLMQLGKWPVIQYIFEAAAASELHKVIVVTSYPEIAAMADSYGFEICINTEAALGQSRSVVLGTSVAGEDSSYMYIPGDMPFLTAETLNALMAYSKKHPRRVIVPCYNGKYGNPCIFPAVFRQDLLAVTGDMGGRAVIRQHEADVRVYPVAEEMQGRDIDCPEEFIKAGKDMECR